VLKQRQHPAGGHAVGRRTADAGGRPRVDVRPRLNAAREPSFGLAPLIVRDLFKILGRINREDKVTILVVEQNAQLALELADKPM